MLLILLCGIFLVSRSARECLAQDAQEPEKREQKIADKYALDMKELELDPEAGIEKVGRLIEEAIAGQAAENVVAKLRVAKALLLLYQPQSDESLRAVEDVLRPIIVDPSSLLRDFEGAKTYVSAVSFQQHVIQVNTSDTGPSEEFVRNAIEEIDATMGLSDREQLITTIMLRLIGCDISLARSDPDYEKALDWLAPVANEGEILSQDDYGAGVLVSFTRQHSRVLAELGRFEKCASVVQNTLANIQGSPQLSAPKRLIHIANLLSKQLLNLHEHPNEPESATALQAAHDHWKIVKEYSGPDRIEVLASGMGIGQVSIVFLGDRDLPQSLAILEQMMKQFEALPEMAESSRAVNYVGAAISSYLHVLPGGDPGEEEFLKRLDSFVAFLIKHDADAVRVFRIQNELKSRSP